MKKKIVFLSLVFLFCSVVCFAQAADIVTNVIETETTTWGQAAYMCAVSQEIAPESSTEDGAIEKLVEASLIKMPSGKDANITYSEASGLLMRTLDLKGGLFYSLTKSNRYAFRELKAKGFIADKTDPSATVSGIEFLNLLNRCIDIMGE